MYVLFFHEPVEKDVEFILEKMWIDFCAERVELIVAGLSEISAVSSWSWVHEVHQRGDACACVKCLQNLFHQPYKILYQSRLYLFLIKK